MISAGVRRVLWVVGDQGISGLTNVTATVIVARSVSSEAFGAYSVGFIVYILALGASRGLVSQPLTVRFSSTEVTRDVVAGAAGAAGLIGVAVGVVAVMVGIVLGGEVGAVLGVVGLLMPALLLQDTWRFLFFTIGHPRRAVANDLTWCVLQVVLMGAVIMAGGGSVALAGAWAGSGAAAALVGVGQTGVRPRTRSAAPFLRSQADLGPWFAIEFVFHTGASQLTALALGGMFGTVGVGALRGGQTLFGPFYLAMTGLMSAAVPEGARLLTRSPSRVLTLLRMMSLVLVAVAGAWGGMLSIVPDHWGVALLGETWQSARQLLLPLAVGAVGYAVASGGVTGLRVRGAAREGLSVRVVVGLLTLAAGVGGGAVAEVDGAAWGLAVGSWATAFGTWWMLDRVVSRPAHMAPSMAGSRGHTGIRRSSASRQWRSATSSGRTSAHDGAGPQGRASASRGSS